MGSLLVLLDAAGIWNIWIEEASTPARACTPGRCMAWPWRNDQGMSQLMQVRSGTCIMTAAPLLSVQFIASHDPDCPRKHHHSIYSAVTRLSQRRHLPPKTLVPWSLKLHSTYMSCCILILEISKLLPPLFLEVWYSRGTHFWIACCL